MEPEVTPQAPADKAAETVKGASTTTPSPTPSPTMVTIPVDEFQNLMGFKTGFADLQRAKEAEIERERGEKIKATTDKDELAKLLKEAKEANETKLNEARTQYLELEQQTFSERKSAVVAQALAGRQFVSPSAAKQVEALIGSNIEVVRNADKSLSVRDKTTQRPAADVLKETLESADYAHHFAATNTQGGANQQGGRTAAIAETPKPGSFDEFAAAFVAAKSTQGMFGPNAQI